MALTLTDIANTNTGNKGVPIEMDNAMQLYSGQVMLAFERKLTFLDLVTVKSTPHGSSQSFPIIGQASDADTNTHVPGTALSMSSVAVRERIINIDALEYFAMAVNMFDEKVLHFETRGELAKQAGEALAVKVDKAVGVELVVASQTSGTIGTGAVQQDGTEIVNAVITTGTTPEAKGNAIVGAIFQAVAELEAKDVTGEKYFVTSPLNYSYLAQSNAINKDVTSGDNGGLDNGNVMSVAGIKIYKSNYMPTDYVITDATGGAELGAVPQGMIFTKDAVGVVKLLDITSEANYLPEELATLLTSYYSYGIGVLNPGASCVIVGEAQDLSAVQTSDGLFSYQGDDGTDTVAETIAINYL